jgi:hypothetical protein
VLKELKPDLEIEKERTTLPLLPISEAESNLEDEKF